MSRSTNRRPSRRQQAEFTRNTARYVNKRFNVSNPFERVLVLLVIAVVVGVMVGVVLPKISPEVGELTGEYAASGPAADVLETLRVDDAQSKDGYDRDLFGYRETDDDGDGCDVRDEVLARDLEDVTFTTPGGCQVQSGVLHDLYTGKTIDFMRGPQTSGAVQIEHVVALENAWQSGARDWDTAKRYKFGNDMYNLLAADGEANSEKGSASAAYWLPTNADFRCEYVARQIGVKDKYDLSVTTKEKQAMLSVLRSCPGQEVPAE